MEHTQDTATKFVLIKLSPQTQTIDILVKEREIVYLLKPHASHV